MTKREKHNLKFYKINDPFGNIDYFCNREGTVNSFNILTILQQLDPISTQGLIDEIQKVYQARLTEQSFSTDGVEEDYIKLDYPNVVFGENDLVIPMMEMKDLLIEWLMFLNS